MTVRHASTGWGFFIGIEVCVVRWGGGAAHGQYHVYLSARNSRAGLPLVSANCIVDDFGDLVEVPE